MISWLVRLFTPPSDTKKKDPQKVLIYNQQQNIEMRLNRIEDEINVRRGMKLQSDDE